MNRDEALEKFEQEGYDWNLRWVNGQYEFWAWKPEWVTDNPYDGRKCPSAREETELDAIRTAYEQVFEGNHGL